MRSPKAYSKKNGPRRGSILLFTVFMLMMAAIAVYTVTNMVSTNLRQVQKAESRLRAFYAAESGVEQVSDWFNRAYYTWLKQQIAAGVYQTTVDIATLHTWEDNAFANTTFQSYFTPWTAANSDSPGQLINSAGESCFGRLVGNVGTGGEQELIIGIVPPAVGVEPIATLDATPNADLYSPYLPTIKDPNTGTLVAKVQYLRITRPPAKVGSRIVAHVTALGVNPSVAAVTVECDLTAPWVPEIVTPAALMAKSGAASNGHFDVNWGEIWSGESVEFLSKFPKSNIDPWFGVSIESSKDSNGVEIGGHMLIRDSVDLTKLVYCDGFQKGGRSATPILKDATNFTVPYPDDPNTDNGFKNRENLRQHVPLKWPDYRYEIMKAFFLRQDYPVYRTTKDGLLTGPDPVTGETVTKSFEDMFNLAANPDSALKDPDDIDWDEMPPMYFIDTIDGKAPAADGSNLPDLTSAGGGPFFYGLFFVAGNIVLGGGGNAPPLNAPEDPGRNVYNPGIKDCRLAGLFYSYGTISAGGNGDVYGAFFAERGFQGDGSWSVYYDWRLADPLRNRTSSRTEPAVWDTYNGQPRNMGTSAPATTTETGG